MASWKRKEKFKKINQTMIRGARYDQQVGHDLKELYVKKVQHFLDSGKSETYAENAVLNAYTCIERKAATYLKRLK